MAYKHIPNFITFSRILVVPFFILCFINPLFKIKLIAFLLFFIGSLSDFIDGYIARKYNLISDIGKIIDPIADKLLIISAFILLYLEYPHYIKFWMIACIITRDVLITLYRFWLKNKGIILQSSIYAKSKTLFQIIIIHFLLFIHTFYLNYFYYNNIIYYLMILCTFFTLFTGLHYIIININNE